MLGCVRQGIISISSTSAYGLVPRLLAGSLDALIDEVAPAGDVRLSGGLGGLFAAHDGGVMLEMVACTQVI